MADMSANINPKPEIQRKAPAGAPADDSQSTTKEEVSSKSTESLQNARNDAEKGWFEEYMYSKNRPVLGTLGKWITAKPVEGIVNAATLNTTPFLGKIARWATVAAAVGAGLYFGIDLLKAGAIAAYEGGEILLDRMGRGAGHLYPAMDLPPAPPSLQELPSADPWANR